MSTKCQNIFLSESSIAYQRLAEAHTEQVGKANPIDLPLINVVKINDTFGEKITNGNIATIYKVNGCSSPRVYKAIPQDRFANGDEIRISKTASDIGVAPTFYSAFLVEQSSTNFVVIEMDDGGKSLGKLMEDLAENSEVQEEEEVVVEAHPLTEKEKAFQAMLKKIRAEVASKYSTVEVTEIPQKKRLPLEEAIDKLYPKREQFYNELFKKIKVLAEHNISWGDSHVGNIMPNRNTDKGLQLIDFNTAKIMASTKTAALASIQSVYNHVHFNNFQKLPNLSKDSLELIDWFES